MTTYETLTLGLVALCTLLYATLLLHGLIAVIQDLRGVRPWWDRSRIVVESLAILTFTVVGVACIPIMYVLGMLVELAF